MATSSRLKTADGKYYATQDFVKNKIGDNIQQLLQTGQLSGIIEDRVSGVIDDFFDEKADKEDVYTKVQIQDKFANGFSFNTL